MEDLGKAEEEMAGPEIHNAANMVAELGSDSAPTCNQRAEDHEVETARKLIFKTEEYSIGG